MQVEMTDLGYEKHDPVGHNSGNSRNGVTKKKLKGDFGELEIETPRDRNGSFEPLIVGKGQTRWTGFDDKILSMYARGMSTRDIQAHLKEMYGVEVSPTLISNVTEAVQEDTASLAKPSSGSAVSDRLPGCAVRTYAGQRTGSEPCSVRRDRHQCRR